MTTCRGPNRPTAGNSCIRVKTSFSLSFVKAKPLSKENAILIDEIKEAVEELKLVSQGKQSVMMTV